MLDTVEAEEDTDWAPDVEVGLAVDFFDFPDMVARSDQAPKLFGADGNDHVHPTYMG